jgi:hypothetical protein
MRWGVFIGVTLIVVAVALGMLAYTSNDDGDTGTVSNAEDAAVRIVVSEFGARLKNVSLAAPTAERHSAMEANYRAYVAPELLAQWSQEGAVALGRYSSSPWPENIDIVEVRSTDGSYVVQGNVIEFANGTDGDSQVAAVYPVTLTLEKREGQWMITEAEKGAYSELPQRRTIVGYWECLPHKDTTGPQTTECALGIAVDQSDGHYAVNTALMAAHPIDFSTGTKVRVTGVVTPANQLSSIQKYDIDGIINATEILSI